MVHIKTFTAIGAADLDDKVNEFLSTKDIKPSQILTIKKEFHAGQDLCGIRWYFSLTVVYSD